MPAGMDRQDMDIEFWWEKSFGKRPPGICGRWDVEQLSAVLTW